MEINTSDLFKKFFSKLKVGDDIEVTIYSNKKKVVPTTKKVEKKQPVKNDIIYRGKIVQITKKFITIQPDNTDYRTTISAVDLFTNNAKIT